MRLLLFGKNGQIGWELRRSLAPLGEIIPLGSDSPNHAGDLSHPEQAAQTILDTHPDAVVNAAAYTSSDKAESEPHRAALLNAHAPAALARACRQTGALLVHYSTDYVFDGTGTEPWREDSPTGPLNTYGSTKLQGDRAILTSGARALILRISWIYSTRGHNFPRTILRLAAEREELRIVHDQIGAPTSADLVADCTAHALRATLANPSLAGLYHLCASGHTSWHGFASFLLENAPHFGHPVKTKRILPIPSTDYPTPARRPLNSRMDCSRFTNTFGLHLPQWQDAALRFLAELPPHPSHATQP